ncbi:ferredoxin [Kitasatospora sp. NPDC088779]|uniref:ferredoxin n=1 Tax=Kitasatospora sp. NPDC088779 TaxID=3154964 RepID=UPI003425B5AE
MGGDWRIEVDGRRCIGSGVCTSTAPGRFTIDDTRRSRPTAGEIAPDERVLDAAFTCPMEAISVVQRSSGLTLFPDAGPPAADREETPPGPPEPAPPRRPAADPHRLPVPPPIEE